MIDQTALSEQFCASYNLASKEVSHIFKQCDDFHDASIDRILSTNTDYFMLEIRHPRWLFLKSSSVVDQLTILRFRINAPNFLVSWGSDDEIAQSSIYNFSISMNEFKIDTGDGGRSGTFKFEGSDLQISTTKKISNCLNLPDSS